VRLCSLQYILLTTTHHFIASFHFNNLLLQSSQILYRIIMPAPICLYLLLNLIILYHTIIHTHYTKGRVVIISSRRPLTNFPRPLCHPEGYIKYIIRISAPSLSSSLSRSLSHSLSLSPTSAHAQRVSERRWSPQVAAVAVAVHAGGTRATAPHPKTKN